MSYTSIRVWFVFNVLVMDHLGFTGEPSSFNSRFIIGKRHYKNTYEVLFGITLFTALDITYFGNQTH